MITSISSLAAKQHDADLHRVARRRLSIPSTPRPNVSAPANAPVVAPALCVIASDRGTGDVTLQAYLARGAGVYVGRRMAACLR
jgi:hypothetical protein